MEPSSQSPDLSQASLEPLPQQPSDILQQPTQGLIEPPLPVPPKPPASRTSQIAGSVLKISALIVVALIGTVLTIIATKTRLFWVMNWCSVGIVIFTGVALFAAIIRIASSVLTESHVRLNELLVTVLFGAAATTVILALFQPAKQSYDARISTAGAVSIITFVLTGLGSAWGWSISTRMKIADGRQRVKMLVFGWMLTVSTILLFVFLLAIIGLLMNPNSSDKLILGLLGLFFLAGIGVALAYPALKMELKWRRELKLKLKK